MSTTRNKQLLHDVFEEMAKGNTRAMGDAMADEFRWTFPGQWSWSGSWEPKRVVLEELLRPLMTQFESYRSQADFIAAEGDRVIVQAHATARTKRGDDYPQTYCYIFRVAGDHLTEVIEHCNTALVDRVLERPAAYDR
jgi:ketosteroid isomerase-like protein